MTDQNGIFTIPATVGTLAMQTPDLKVYKPGYVGWSSRLIYLGCFEKDRKVFRAKEREGFAMIRPDNR